MSCIMVHKRNRCCLYIYSLEITCKTKQCILLTKCGVLKQYHIIVILILLLWHNNSINKNLILSYFHFRHYIASYLVCFYPANKNTSKQSHSRFSWHCKQHIVPVFRSWTNQRMNWLSKLFNDSLIWIRVFERIS